MFPTEDPSERPVIGLERFMQWWWIGGRAARGVWVGFLVLAFLYVAGIVLVGMGPVNGFATDVFVQLDGGWRVYQGQVPHRDFYSALGALEYSITGLGFLLTRGSANGIPVGNVVFGIAIGVWGWFVARRRMLLVPSLLVAAWLLITATCPSPLGAPSHVISGAEIYNRHGYVLLCILLIESAFGSEESFWDGISSGAVLVLLGFLKLNFFGAAILLLLASLPFRWRDKQRALGFLLGTAATLTVFVLYLRFSVGPFLRDMSLALASRSSSLSRGAIFHWLLGSDKHVAGVLFATLALALLAAAGKRAQSKGIGILVSGLAVVLTGLMVWVTDFGEAGIALAAVWLLIVVGHLSVVYAKSSEKFAINVVVLLCLSAIYMDFSDAARSYLALLKYGRASRVGAGLSIANRNVEHMRFYEDENYPLLANNGSLYVQRINDGLALLDKVLIPGDRILTLGHNNPFPFILRLKPMRGGSTWLQPGSNVSLQHLMPTDRIFGDATILMVCYIDPDLPKAYAPFIEANFVQVAKSPVWTVYRRRSL